jgi:hypothetical protein
MQYVSTSRSRVRLQVIVYLPRRHFAQMQLIQLRLTFSSLRAMKMVPQVQVQTFSLRVNTPLCYYWVLIYFLFKHAFSVYKNMLFKSLVH